MLSRSAAGGLGLVLSGSLPGLFGTGVAQARHATDPATARWSRSAGILSLPGGFSYTIVAQAGVTLLDSGEPTPDDPDGTAAFVRRGGSGTVLVNNHEISGGETFGVPRVAGFVYDAAAHGGTTNIEVDRRGKRVASTSAWPARTTTAPAAHAVGDVDHLRGDRGDPRQAARLLFEVDPYDQDANRNPQPITCLGRFAHESIVVDPRPPHDLPHRGRRQPERAALPLDAAARARCRCAAAR